MPARRLDHWINEMFYRGNFSSTARVLIDYFEVTWHLTIELFPAKSLWAVGNVTKSITSWRNSARSPLHVNRAWTPAWIYHEGSMTVSEFFKVKRRSQSPYACFQSFFKVTDLQMATAHALVMCPDKKLPGLWRRKIPKRDNWWQKLPYSHSEPSVKENILTKTAILTKFQKKNETNSLLTFIVSFNAREKTGGNYKKTARTQAFALARNDFLSWKDDLTSLPTMLSLNSLTESVFEAVVVQLKRQGSAKSTFMNQ